MADKSTIEWTDATWQIITGCSVVSPGCTNCYAMKLAGSRLQHHPSRANLTSMTKAGPVWNGAVRFNEEWLTQPLQWKKPRRIFVCAHGDLFHENVRDEWIDQVFAVMALAPQHTFQVLTKRSKRMREYLQAIDAEFHCSPDNLNERFGEHCVQLSGDPCAAAWFEDEVNWPLRNVWLGVSTEDQRRADERIPDLLATPAAVRFISAEPLLGAIDLTNVRGRHGNTFDVLETNTYFPNVSEGPAIDWVIAGGESGAEARPMHPDWARRLRDQCAEVGVPFFFKQWGSYAPLLTAPPVIGWGIATAWPDGSFGEGHSDRSGGAGCQMFLATKKIAGRLLDGVEHNGMPEAMA